MPFKLSKCWIFCWLVKVCWATTLDRMNMIGKFQLNKPCAVLHGLGHAVWKFKPKVQNGHWYQIYSTTHQSNQISTKYDMRRGKVKSDDLIQVIWISSTSAAAQMVFHHAVQEVRFAHVAGLKNSRPFRYLLKNWPSRCPTNIINERSSSSLQGIGFENDMGWTGDQNWFWAIKWAFLTDQKQIWWHVHQIFMTD